MNAKTAKILRKYAKKVNCEKIIYFINDKGSVEVSQNSQRGRYLDIKKVFKREKRVLQIL